MIVGLRCTNKLYLVIWYFDLIFSRKTLNCLSASAKKLMLGIHHHLDNHLDDASVHAVDTPLNSKISWKEKHVQKPLLNSVNY